MSNLILYHAPKSRSTRLLWLLEELNADYEVRYIDIRRMSGEGAYDPANPHPLKQSPALEHHGAVITESVVIMDYLCDLYPEAGLAPPAGTPEAARFAAWLGLYNAVLEPVVIARFGGAASDIQNEAFGFLDRTLTGALEAGPYLMGDTFSAADILFSSLLLFYRSSLPDHAIYDDWVARVTARPAYARAQAKDAAAA